MTEKLTITGSADLLGRHPAHAGRPAEGILRRAHRPHGNTLGATLRVDAPAEAAPVDYAQTMATYAANDEKATGQLGHRLHRREPAPTAATPTPRTSRH